MNRLKRCSPVPKHFVDEVVLVLSLYHGHSLLAKVHNDLCGVELAHGIPCVAVELGSHAAQSLVNGHEGARPANPSTAVHHGGANNLARPVALRHHALAEVGELGKV